MASHKSIKRILCRVMEEIRSTVEIAKYTSVSDAAATFRAKVEIQKMNHNGFQEPPHVRDRLIKKHEVMIAYFEKKYAQFLSSYQPNRTLPDNNPGFRNRIWLCWWQGLDQAPDLVKRCVESVMRNAGPYTVSVITEDNYRDYVTIPEIVEQKYRNGIISRTHFSDMLRLCLMAEHGGIWLDATFFCTAPVLSQYIQMPLWTIKRPDYRHGSVASGYFATYSLGCSYEYRWVFAAIRDFVEHYWLHNDGIIDYLFLDYLFVLAQRKDPELAAAFSAVPSNNPCCDDLGVILGESYDEQKWVDLKKDTSLFKLTWKQSFASEKNGKITYYGKMLEGSL